MDSFSDDVFGVQRAFASQIVRDLMEAWTLEEKDRIARQMRERRSAELIEHVQIGDYDLVLWHYTKAGIYAVSLNSGHEDPTTPEGQKKKPAAEQLRWNEVVMQLRRWIRQHGRLLIGSFFPERTARYRHLLVRYFLIANWTDNPQDGFFILPD